MNAYDLLEKMASVPLAYGMWDKTQNKALSSEDLDKLDSEEGYDYTEKNCIVLKPEEVWRKKVCTCWDASLLEYDELKRMGYSYITANYYEIADRKNEVFGNHAFIVYQEKKSKGFYWFEYTWYRQCGLHGPYVKEDEIYNEVSRLAISEPGDTISYWSRNFDITRLLKLDEISVVAFQDLVHPGWKSQVNYKYSK